MWDDWGGWFDPAPPIYADYDGLGFRIPLLIVSPYAKQNDVTHVQYETSSVVRYIEDNFGLPQLAPSDTRANDPATDAFDYTQKPRPFRKITGGKPAAQWFPFSPFQARARAAENSSRRRLAATREEKRGGVTATPLKLAFRENAT